MSTHNIQFFNMKKNHHKLSQICRYGNFSKGLKNEFERVVVNEPSVFEPLKFYCMSQTMVPPPVPSGFINQPTMETQVYLPPGPHMNFPQQMLHCPNQLHQMPQPPSLSDDDILRVATQIKSLLRDEINDLVDAQVAQKIEPLKNELA